MNEKETKALRRLSELRAMMVACRVPRVQKGAVAFFAAMIVRLSPVINYNVPTIGTDGKVLAINPDFILSLTSDEGYGVFAHEVYHCVLEHPWRGIGRNENKWQIATDLSINPLLVASGFSLPFGALLPEHGKYKHLKSGLSAEQYYDLLKEEDQPDPPPMGGGSDPGNCGGVLPPSGGEAEHNEQIAQTKVAAIQAATAAKAIGNLPAGLQRLIEEISQPKADWRQVLWEFVSKRVKTDYSYRRPNRRWLSQGTILPSLDGEELGDIVVAIDCSGSIGQRELDAFASELQAIAELFKCRMVILYHDVAVHRIQIWEPSDGELKLKPAGGGGTSHIPVLNEASKVVDAEVCICFTDMMTEFPRKGPPMPVLWAAYGGYHYSKPPFGTVVEIT